MKRNAIILLLFASSLLIHAGPDGSNEATFNIMLNDETDCTKYRGEKLKECLACLSLELLLENLTNLSTHARKNHFNSLSEDDRKKFLVSFTPQAWEHFYGSLEDDERTAFEPTLEQQEKKWFPEPEVQIPKGNETLQCWLVGGGIVVIVGFMAFTNPPLAIAVGTKAASLYNLGNGTRKIG